MANSADPDQKPTDLNLHCLQRQGIFRFSRTRVHLSQKRWLEWNTKPYFERKWDNITLATSGENMPSDTCFHQTEISLTFAANWSVYAVLKKLEMCQYDTDEMCQYDTDAPALGPSSHFMIIYLCIKFESNTLIFSKDIEWKPFFVTYGMDRTDGTDVSTDSGDTICSSPAPTPPPPPTPPIENGGGIKT